MISNAAAELRGTLTSTNISKSLNGQIIVISYPCVLFKYNCKKMLSEFVEDEKEKTVFNLCNRVSQNSDCYFVAICPV